MTTLINSLIDPNALGPNLETQLSGQVLTCNQNGQSINRCARGTIGKSSGVWYFEACFYANNLVPGAPISLAGLASIGIAKGTASLSTMVGEDADSLGYAVGDGGVLTSNAYTTGTTPANGTTSVTLDNGAVPAAHLQVWIGVLADITARTVTFSVNGNDYCTADMPSTGVWFPAITVANYPLPAYSILGFLNTGQRAFRFPKASAPGGWYKLSSAQPLSVYLTPDFEGGLTSGNADTPQNQIYAGRILNADSLTIARSATVWVWGQAGASATYGSIIIDNFDGAYDWMLSQDMRDSQVALKVVNPQLANPLASSTTVATTIIDSVYAGGGSAVGSGGGAEGEKSITINIRDTMSLLQKPLQRRLFEPFADVGVANAPLPITLGAVRNITPMLRYTDTTGAGAQHYQIHDDQLTALATVRDKGAPLDPNSSPPQYGPDAAAGQFYLASPPVGALTCDASSVGGQVVIPGVADVLGGIGGFAATSWGAAGSPPPGFTIDTLSGSQVRQGTGGSSNEMSMYLGTVVPFKPSSSQFGFHVHTTATWLQPGQSYLITFRIKNVQGQFITAGVLKYGFGLVTSISSTSPRYCITPYDAPLNVGLDPFVPAQTYSYVYTCPGTVALPIYICMGASPGGSSGAFGTISNLVIEQLGAYNAQQQLPLKGIDLGDYFSEILTRAKATTPPVAAVTITDTTAITTAIAAAAPTGSNWAKGYTFGQHFPVAVMSDVALQSAMDSFCGTVFTDNLGQLRVRRLADPATALIAGATIAANFDSTAVQYGVTAEPDYASGLTTQIGARRNYRQLANTDLVTDYVTMPGYLRTQFARRSQFIQSSGVTLANTYAFAQTVSPLDSCLDDPTQAQFEIDRVCAPYSATRATLPRFFTFTICYEGIPPLLLFGDFITLNYPRFGLNPTNLVNNAGGTISLAGYPLMVKDTVLNPSMQTLQITAWG